MKTRAALIWEQPAKFSIEEVELHDPSDGEVLVEMVATGICYSDEHIASGSVKLGHYPHCSGHEGSGIVRKVGPNVKTLEVGDHIITSFIPACGKCIWCARGMQNLCDNGALIMTGSQLDGTYRMFIGDDYVSAGGTLGAYAEWQVYDELSCVKMDKDIPLDAAALLACGVQTGYGSSTNAADVQPGDVVIIMGVGGVGMNAVQGAAQAGARTVIAVDPVSFKREQARGFGATDVFADIEEAADFARSLTGGQGADSAVVTVGDLEGVHIDQAFRAIRKAGTVVVTSQGGLNDTGIPVNLFMLSMYQKRIQGSLYGMESPRSAVPKLVSMYRSGALKLDELITRRYTLDDINQGFEDMRNGLNIRGIIDYRLGKTDAE